MLFLLALLCARGEFMAGPAYCASDSECIADGVDFRAQFAGASGTLKIYPKSDTGAWMMAKLDKFEEIDGDTGAVVESFNLNQGIVQWTNPLSITVAEPPCRYILSTFNSTLKTLGNVPFNFYWEAMLMTSDCVPPKDTDMVALKNQLKYQFELSNYPFKKGTNKLRFTQQFECKGGDGAQKDASKAGRKACACGVGWMEMPMGGYIDSPDNWIDFPDLVVEAPSGNKKYNTITYTLPYFAKYLRYDPVIGAASATLPSILLIAVLALFWSLH